jgi:hypothetical protein
MVASFDVGISTLTTTAGSEGFLEAINARREGREPNFKGQ